MTSPSLPPVPKTSAVPQLVDPTVMFARLRQRQLAQSATGRDATVLKSPYPSATPGTLGAALKLGA